MEHNLSAEQLQAAHESADPHNTARRGCVLQTEEMFRDIDASAPEHGLQGLVIERNMSTEQLETAHSKSGIAADRPDDSQLTVNAPALLDRPVPAKANPMARLHETGTAASPSCKISVHPCVLEDEPWSALCNLLPLEPLCSVIRLSCSNDSTLVNTARHPGHMWYITAVSSTCTILARATLSAMTRHSPCP